MKPFVHTAKDPDLQLWDPPVRTGQGLGIWFVVIESALLQWLALIIHLTLSSLVCAPGGSYQQGFTYVIPCEMEAGRYEGWSPRPVAHRCKGFFKTTGFQVSSLHKCIYLATAVFLMINTNSFQMPL
jgi:hypothetical protein